MGYMLYLNELIGFGRFFVARDLFYQISRNKSGALSRPWASALDGVLDGRVCRNDLQDIAEHVCNFRVRRRRREGDLHELRHLRHLGHDVGSTVLAFSYT